MSGYRLTASVSGNIECAHRSKLGALHGHSYVAEVVFDAGPDLDMTREAVRTILDLVDHTQLEDSIGGSTMEALAVWVLDRVSLIGNGGMTVRKVIIRRPTLGYAVEASRM